MFCVFDRLNTDDISREIMLWKNYMAYISQQAGFVSGSLYSKSENNIDNYECRQLVGIYTWAAKENYQAAKKKYDLNNLFKEKWGDQENFDLIIGQPYTVLSNTRPISIKTPILITLSGISNEQEDGFVTKWQQAKDYMKEQDGFIGTSFYKLIDSTKFKFMNVAVWENENKFLNAINHNRFKKIIHDGYEESCFTSVYNKILGYVKTG